MINANVHMGRNVRNLRVLMGVKQSSFARNLGISQQNVSKMEKKKDLSLDKLEKAAKALGVTVETVKEFNERIMFNNNIALESGAGQNIHPIKEVIDYFKEELAKRDAKIESQAQEIAKLKVKVASEKASGAKGLRSVGGKQATR